MRNAADRSLPENPPESETPVVARIGELVAGLIEMISERLVDLIESGAVHLHGCSVHERSGRTAP